MTHNRHSEQTSVTDAPLLQIRTFDETDKGRRDAERNLEDRFGDMYRLDAREAIYLAGMQNLDDAESILREWGYDF